MPNTVVDLVGQGDGVRPWGGCWPPYWDSASSDLGSEGTRGLCTSRAEERLRPTAHSSPGKDHSLCCPTPWASGPHTLGLGGRAWPPGDGPCLRAPGSMPGDLFLRLD